MNVGQAAKACRDHLVTELGDNVDLVRVWTGELPDSIEHALSRRDATGFTVLVGLRRTGQAIIGAAQQTMARGAILYITVIRTHGGRDNLEEQMIELMDMMTTVQNAINKPDIPKWWATAGFKALQEGDLNNFSNAALDYSAYELELHLVIQ